MTCTTPATPVSVRKSQPRANYTAGVARFAAGIEPAHLLKSHTPFEAHPCKDQHELTEAVVAHLPTPELLHTPKVQVLDRDQVVVIAQLVGPFEEPVSALVSRADGNLSKLDSGLAPVDTAFVLARKTAVRFSVGLDILLEKARRAQTGAVWKRQKHREAEVQSHRVRYFLVWGRMLCGLNNTETEPETSRTVSFDRNGFYLSRHGSAFDKAMDPAPDTDTALTEVGPSRLLEREAGIAQAFLEAGPSYALGVFEEAVIGFVETLYDVLDGLRAEALPGFRRLSRAMCFIKR